MAAIGRQIDAGSRRIGVASCKAQPRPFTCCRVVNRKRNCVVRAQADGDDDLDARLAALRKAKGATPDKQGSKAQRREGTSKPEAVAADKKAYDWSDEKVHWEGGPAAGDLAFNIGLGFTIVALPLTIGAIARTAFIKYRFTDKRVSVTTSAPWESKQTDCAYQEVKDVRTVSRGLGAWGDMVIELKNGDKLELRSVEKFKELREYVLARRDALGGGPPSNPSIMDLDVDDDVAMKKSRKGFA